MFTGGEHTKGVPGQGWAFDQAVLLNASKNLSELTDLAIMFGNGAIITKPTEQIYTWFER